MSKMIATMAVVATAALMAGCAHMSSKTDLGQAAKDAKLQNVTTGDGTYENYKATGYHAGTEIGIAVGIPLVCKIMEIYPKQTDTEQMTAIAKDAQADGANAVINAHPTKSVYTGFPLVFVGIYVDSADGTGIKTEK